LARADSPDTIFEDDVGGENLSIEVPTSARQSTSDFEQLSDQTPRTSGLMSIRLQEIFK
jgi:hypothetical protein